MISVKWMVPSTSCPRWWRAAMLDLVQPEIDLIDPPSPKTLHEVDRTTHSIAIWRFQDSGSLRSRYAERRWISKISVRKKLDIVLSITIHRLFFDCMHWRRRWTLKSAIFTISHFRDLDFDLGSGHLAYRRVAVKSLPIQSNTKSIRPPVPEILSFEDSKMAGVWRSRDAERGVTVQCSIADFTRWAQLRKSGQTIPGRTATKWGHQSQGHQGGLPANRNSLGASACRQGFNHLTPTVAIWVQLWSILCQTGLSRHL